MSIQILLIWDYDTPTGFDVSKLGRGYDPMCEYESTDRVLDLLVEYDVVSTFACVGKAALPGDLPYHNPAQIRRIHQLGHEIASHSYNHDYIPALSRSELIDTLSRSKSALEDCVGEEVTGFVPPWNRPFHHPRRSSISLRELRDGGGWWKQSIVSLCRALRETGYQWVRVSYSNLLHNILKKLVPGMERGIKPMREERYSGIKALSASYMGFDPPVRDQLSASKGGETYLIWAHPHGIEHPNSQNWQHLVDFLNWYAANRKKLDITFLTPRDWIEQQITGHSSTGDNL